MKAETKAKRRLTLSLVGLGFLDESETEGGQTVDVDPETGEVREPRSRATSSTPSPRSALASTRRPTQRRPPAGATTRPPRHPVRPSAAAVAPSAAAAEPATATCGDEDASPMALGLCAKPPHTAGPRKR
jgi:hypothetical protein